jgi:hypothetical protein
VSCLASTNYITKKANKLARHYLGTVYYILIEMLLLTSFRTIFIEIYDQGYSSVQITVPPKDAVGL